MSLGGRAWDVLRKRDNLIHIFLGCSFVALCIRSVGQQNDIESLQAEKEQLQKTNKAMKKAIWDWKQQLFQEASQDATAYPVPLSRLKAIYGDTVSQQDTHSAISAHVVAPGEAGETETANSTSARTKFVV